MFIAVLLVFTLVLSFAAGSLAFLIHRSIRRGRIGLKQAVRTDVGLVSHKCEHCSGGVQVLNEDGWGPFTPAQMSLGGGSRYLESRSANTRNCPACTGKGFQWEDIPNKRPWSPPNLGYIEHQRKLFRRSIRSRRY